MNGIMICGSLGAMVAAALAALSSPPADSDAPESRTATRQVFITRQLDTAEPPTGKWEANLPPVGQLSIVVDSNGKRVLVNGKALPPDRVIWQPDNLVMLIDESRQRQFEVALGEKGSIKYVRPNSWLEYRGANAPRVAIGIYTDPITPPLASQLGLDIDAALLVTGVVKDLPAFKSGVHQFDIITAIDDQDRVSQETLKRVVFSKEPGQTIQLRLLRKAQPLELTVDVEKVDALDQNAADPFFGTALGGGDLIEIDGDTYRSPDIWFPSDRPVIEFKGEDSAIVVARQSFDLGSRAFTLRPSPDSVGDIQGLEMQIKVLTERITNLEALIARLAGDQPAVGPAGIKP